MYVATSTHMSMWRLDVDTRYLHLLYFFRQSLWQSPELTTSGWSSEFVSPSAGIKGDYHACLAFT